MDDDPKTLAALEKIKAILVEHDLWACVTVTDTTRSHWLYYFEPSWSCAHLDDTGRVHIKAKVADFATPEAQHNVVEQTTGAIFNTRDFAVMLFGHMDIIAKELEKVMQIEHRPFTDIKIKRDKP